MQNQEKADAKSPVAETQTKSPKVEVQVERFPTTKPKFSKEAWDSGEGGGEGEG
jgi:hypothetical protein